ncbi:ferric reductase-like transmembrane domain-containing protein [Georgenia yuyongxinii]|uniref:Oxidoreductase n=1 Tax=Georgenia yuyongxinii TaxID=2589797 RepID=A0A552WKV3_9MICO|nr:ferric reductase-like transmembrane domain-containing protein [Georgenia yuyongxinii]TRW43366.1 oxidoreductase [Georgenia yuyongxinii]
MAVTAYARRARPLRPDAATVPVWWRDSAGLLAWGSMLVVVALWVHDGGLQDLVAGGPGAVTTLGRVTGLVAADLMLVQVVLMARVPFVERSFGQDELARRHRLVGLASFWLLLGHVVLIVLGYAMAARSGVLAMAWGMVRTFPGMLLATVGTALLVLVVSTSARAARRRLRYESWHLLHLYGYLGGLLVVPHMVWTGAEFTTNAAARAYWWTAWGAAVAAVLAFRLALPAWRSRRHRVVVDRVHHEAPGVVSVHLRGRDLGRLPVQAGNFFVWRFAGPGRTRGHPLSLSASPTATSLRVTAKVTGDGTARLAGLRPGTPVTFEGPYGRLTQAARTRSGVVLLACGIGITPMRALLEDLGYPPGEATLIYRARSEAELALREELHQIAARRGARVIELVGARVPDRSSWLPAWAGGWDDAAALLDMVPDAADRDIYICGPDGWMDAAAAAARRAGVPQAQTHLERFTM